MSPEQQDKLPPDRITPDGLEVYLEVMARAIFQAGMRWEVVEKRWPGIVEAFGGFEPERVSGTDEAGIEELMEDERLIRNRRKIVAVVANAGKLLELAAEFDGFEKYLDAAGDFEAESAALKRDFSFMGDFGCYYFLYVVGREVPPHDEWRAEMEARRAKGGK